MNIETIILGTFMKESYLLDDTPITANHFENETNRRLFESMRTIRQQGQGVDAVTIMAYYDPREFGGAPKLLDIQDQANPEKITDYTKALKDAYKEREKRNILSRARMEDWPLEQIQSELDKLTDDSLDDHSSMKDLILEVVEAPWEKHEEVQGVTTGLKELDAMTHGLQDSELTILAARPSMGRLLPLVSAMRQANPVNVIA
ncbi:DnaB-like helicase C-terminal domain-containing protein [Bhargavaea ginsengi]|uniref:DnaB-like helicase C-terminal domain-containing protein n=1 Tax=Bhargavaea ginsengi TaxID=426757 RepID=UPI003C7255A2